MHHWLRDRLRLGLAVFAVALITVAVWLYVATMQATQRAEAQAATVSDLAASTRYPLNVRVEDGVVSLSGVFDTVEEAARVRGALAALDALQVVDDAIAVLPLGAPFVTELIRQDAGFALQGMSGSMTGQDALSDRVGEATDALVLHGGAPKEWTAAMLVAVDALAMLKSGRIVLRDTHMRVSGLVATPDDLTLLARAVEAVPDSYTVEIAVEVEDDGRPFAVHAAFDGTTLVLSGHVPRGLSPMVLTRARRLADVSGTVTELRRAPPSEDWLTWVERALDALTRLERGALSFQGTALALTGSATDAALAEVESALSELPSTLSITLSVETPLPVD